MRGEKKVKGTSRQWQQEEESLCSPRIPTRKKWQSSASIVAQRHPDTSPLLLPWSATMEQIKVLRLLCCIPSSVHRWLWMVFVFLCLSSQHVNWWSCFLSPLLHTVFYIPDGNSAWRFTFPAPGARSSKFDACLLLVTNTACPCFNLILI